MVTDASKPQAEGHTAMIDAVSEVMHIALPDKNGKIDGGNVIQHGVIGILSPSTGGLCTGVTSARYATIAEVYPDNPNTTSEQCNPAQVRCITAGLDHIIRF